jgi:hypothetical protein
MLRFIVSVNTITDQRLSLLQHFISKDVAKRIDRRQDLVDTIVAIVSVVASKNLRTLRTNNLLALGIYHTRYGSWH